MNTGLVLLIGLTLLASFLIGVYVLLCTVSYLNTGKAAFRRYLDLNPAPGRRSNVLPPAPGEWREPHQ